MTKDRVARHILERLALMEIRARRGCEGVVAIEIEYAPCRPDTNWKIATVDCGRTNSIEHATQAIAFTHEKLRRQYNLLTDS